MKKDYVSTESISSIQWQAVIEWCHLYWTFELPEFSLVLQ